MPRQLAPRVLASRFRARGHGDPRRRSDRVRPVVLLVVCGLLLAGLGGQSAAATAYQLLVSTAPDRSGPVNLDGATVSANLYVFTAPESGVRGVTYFLDDPAQTGTPYHSEGAAPFDLAGTTPSNTGRPFDSRTLTDGTHTLTQQVRTSTGTVVTTATFTVANTGAPPPAPVRVAAAAGGGFVGLSWASGGGSTAGFQIYRATTTPVSTDGAPLASTDAATTSYRDGAVTAGTTYYYVVRAVDGSGRASAADPVSATPTGTTPATAGGYTLLLSSAPDRSAPQGLEGTSVSASAYVFTDPAAGVRRVAYYLDDPTLAGTPFHSEGAAPYDLVGTASTGAALPLDTTKLADGAHSVTQQVTTTSGAVVVTSSRFTVANAGAAPPAPVGVTATGGSGAVDLSWTSGGGSTAGFDVLRSTTSAVDPSAPALATLDAATTRYSDAQVTAGTTYYYAVRSRDSGGRTAVSATVSATPTAPPTSASFQDVRVNFGPESFAPPAGYVPDFGEAYAARSGLGRDGLTFGWVQDATSTPLSLVGNTRDRSYTGQTDRRLASMIHVQGGDIRGFSGVTTPGAWELAVPAGSYTVTVAVGDAGSSLDSRHTVNIEGQNAVWRYQADSGNRFATATRTVRVTDGNLTLSPTGGTNTKLDYVDVLAAPDAATRPAIRSVNPANTASGFPVDGAVTGELALPTEGAGVDATSLTDDAVTLTRVDTGARVVGHANTTGGGDALVFQPEATLDPTTTYRFDVTSAVRDASGASFEPFSSVFTTGSGSSTGDTLPGVSFDQVALPTATGHPYTSLTLGPDGKLYAATLSGEIDRFVVNPDGTLGPLEALTGIVDRDGPRAVVGLAFDPTSTADNLVAWVSTSSAAYNDAPDWSGKIQRLSGPNLATVTDYVVNLPRSIRDHETNSVVFGPDGAMYVPQGSMSSMGAPDSTWGDRPEHLLSAAVLRFDPSKVTTLPLDVKTEDGGSYDPFAPGAPLTIYASGLRNAFDLVWHSNGKLYAPTNGAAGTGNTPGTPSTLPPACNNRIDAATNGAYTGPAVPGLTGVSEAQSDYLFQVQAGGYYGHPNPTRCEWVENGGNPTAFTDPAEVSRYPRGTAPDRNWRGSAYDFGLHYSPDGAVEYSSASQFGGALKGKLLVVRYSAGDDVVALSLGGPGGKVDHAYVGIPGLTGLTDPVDVTEDRRTGFLYVSEISAGRITLLRPTGASSPPPPPPSGSPAASVTPDRLVASSVTGTASASQTVTVTNTGTATLTVSGLSVTGADAAQFRLVSPPALPATVAPGQSLAVAVAYQPSGAGVHGATLTVTTDDPAAGTRSVTLRGVATSSRTVEPSLQWLFDAYQIPLSTGDPNPADATLPPTNPLGDEIPAQTFVKAGSGPVTIRPLAVYGPTNADPVVRVGWTPKDSASGRTELYTVPVAEAKTVSVHPSGSTTFDPGTGAFGFYTTFPGLSGGLTIYQQDSLNTFGGALPHQTRVYPYRNPDGSTVPNTFVVASEDYAGPKSDTCCDWNDDPFVVSNVVPAGNGGAVALRAENLDGVPGDSRMVFNRIGTTLATGSDAVHDVATLRVHNDGTVARSLTAIDLAGPFQLASTVALPATVPAGGAVDVPVRFVAVSGAKAQTGTLTLTTNDPARPQIVVALAGAWQPASGGNNEPTLADFVTTFGYQTATTYAGQKLNTRGHVGAVGDEVLSQFWVRADPSKPVHARMIAAFHGANAYSGLYAYPKGTTAACTFGGGPCTRLLLQTPSDAQSILPRQATASGALVPAQGDYNPSGVFGWNSNVKEYSEDARNSVDLDRKNGCVDPCGHHLRFYPLKDATGAVVPDTWLLAVDFASSNYDYQDALFVISNMRPEAAAAQPASGSAPPPATASTAPAAVTRSRRGPRRPRP